MAAGVAQEDQSFENEQWHVEIFQREEDSLGIGSYGAVYRAKFGELSCAAKILHPILFQTNDPAGQRIVQRFHQECDFLRAVKHPNIVQYLGVTTDKDSGLPILLMELLDESLTNFLEKSRNPLPYYIQFNLCQDIALAIAYLHFKGIVHRDLSSNNVLLITGSKAKVTDFGMSRLDEATGRVTRHSLTHLPGTQVYMPPEAFLEPPQYTNKIDCFSFGTLIIQMITRLFPDPGPRSTLVPDPRSPTGTAQMPVLEVDRRMNHISLIDFSHPLLPIARQCLEYTPGERPTGQQLCRQLATLKELDQYTESKDKQAPHCVEVSLAKDIEIADLHNLLENKERAIQAKDELIKIKDNLCREKENEIEQLKRTIQDYNRQPKMLESSLQGSSEGVPLATNSRTEMEPEIQHSREQPQSITKKKTTKAESKIAELKWKLARAPYEVSRGYSVTDHTTAYIRDGYNSNLCMYDSVSKGWAMLPNCPRLGASLTVLDDVLTTVGGYVSYFSGFEMTNSLFSLVVERGEKKWVEKWPPMPTKRYSSAAVCYEDFLIVAGGAVAKNVPTNAVEILNLFTRQWCTAASLPLRLRHASAVIYGESLYLCGWIGVNHRAKPCPDVLMCTLSELQASATPYTIGARLKTVFSKAPAPATVWRRVASLPVGRSSFVVFNNQLLAIGGRDSDGRPSNGIYWYNLTSDSWTAFYHMPEARSDCHVAVFPDNKLFVIGGCAERRHHQSIDIQIASFD